MEKISCIVVRALSTGEKVPKMLRPPNSASRYDSKFMVKTVKHPGSKMVWEAFSGNLDRAGLYYLFENVTMKRSNYINASKEHLLAFWRIYQCDHFMHDGAPAHKSKIAAKFINNHNIRVSESPDNSPDLNPIENAWSFFKKIRFKRRNQAVPIKCSRS